MTTTATPTQIKSRDTVELLKAQWIVDPKLGRQKIADEGIYEVEYVMTEPDKLRLKSLLPYSKEGFWVPLEDVRLVETYISPQELITPVQEDVYSQFNGRPRGLWELVEILGQPGPIVKGALDGLERQGLIEEVELDVWRKVNVQQDDASRDFGEKGENTQVDSEPTRDIPSCDGERDGDGQTSSQETPSPADGDRGAVPLSESAVVCGEENQRPDWVIEAETELNKIQWQIDNCAVEREQTTDKELKKVLYAGYKENRKEFIAAVFRYTEIAKEMGCSFGFGSNPKDKRYNQIVVYIQPLEQVCAEPRVAKPQSKLGEILNLAANSEAKAVVSTSTLKEQEAEADRLWEMRSQLEGQLLHCLAQIYLGGEWRSNYKTWTQYFIATFSKWQKTQRYRMKDAGELFAQFLQLSPQGDSETPILPLPTSEGQLRELKALPAPKRVPTWQQIVKEYGESPPRTVVAEVVKKVKTELQQPAQLQAQVKTEEEIAAQFNCIVGDPVRVTYTGRARGLESDVAPQYDGLIGVVQKLGVAGALVYVPILRLTMRCTPSQMVAVPLPSESRTICDRIRAIMANDLELSPMMRGALEALSRQLEYSEDDLWLLGQIEERLTPLDPNQSLID